MANAKMKAMDFVKQDERIDFTPRGLYRYDVNVEACNIEWRNRGENFDTENIKLRKSEEYLEAQDLFYELTMSCTVQEAMFWLKQWMYKARAYAGTKLDMKTWEAYYLAAFDIWHKLWIEEGRP